MLVVNRNEKKQIYMQIYEYYRDRILDSGIGAGCALPSTRRLADELSVSRNTVETAYQQLAAEGYIYSRCKSGYYAADMQHLHRMECSVSFRAHDDTADEDKLVLPGINCNFQYGRLEADTFPLRIWKRISDKVFLDTAPDRMTGYTSRTGEPEFKNAIARYIYSSRNVACDADCIVVCSGLLTTVGLLCQLFRQRTKTVAVEDPCYDTVREIFINNGYEVKPVAVTPDGIDMEQLTQSGAGLLYITPSHQFPTGRVMSAANRIRLLKWAEENDAYIIEDDYDSEYRYSSKPLSPLQTLDAGRRVIYVNTFSKALAPALRIGFMVLPEELKKEYDDAFSHYSCTVPLLSQLETAEFMTSGQWNRHLRKIAIRNGQKHNMLVSEIKNAMGEQVKIIGSGAGLHFLMQICNGMDEEALISAAEKNGVRVYPVSPYYYGEPSENNVVLIGFSSISLEQIPEGIAAMEKAWFG